MDLTQNTTILLYRNMLEAFEKYETLFENINNLDLEAISNQQLQCLASIETMIWDENDYFESLYNLYQDLTYQINHIQTLQSQLTINDLTIMRVNNQNPVSNPNISNLIQKPEFKYKDKSDEINKKLIDTIQSTLIAPNATGLIDISGLENEKKTLKEAIIYPIMFPHLFTGSRKKWNSALLYGPPGTGKTQLANCLAAEVGCNFYNVSSADLLSSYVGESEKLIKTLFKHCQTGCKYSIIFIDEIDGICRSRNSSEKEFERRFKNEFLNQLSLIDKQKNNKIFVLACTNCPWDLDIAFIRRFHKRIYIPLPDRATRYQMLQNRNIINEIDLNKILDMTLDWSGSDIQDLINCAEYQPLKDLETVTHWIITPDNKFMPSEAMNYYSIAMNIQEINPSSITVRPVEARDYFTALNEVTKTVTHENINRFVNFNNMFGTCKK